MPPGAALLAYIIDERMRSRKAGLSCKEAGPKLGAGAIGGAIGGGGGGGGAIVIAIGCIGCIGTAENIIGTAEDEGMC